jgi:hypothetical protein
MGLQRPVGGDTTLVSRRLSEANGRRPRRHEWTVALCAVLLGVGCRRGERDKPEPVRECVEYESMVARCMGIQAPISSQPEALAKTDGQREQVKKVCSMNLERLKSNCR